MRINKSGQKTHAYAESYNIKVNIYNLYKN